MNKTTRNILGAFVVSMIVFAPIYAGMAYLVNLSGPHPQEVVEQSRQYTLSLYTDRYGLWVCPDVNKKNGNQ